MMSPLARPRTLLKVLAFVLGAFLAGSTESALADEAAPAVGALEDYVVRQGDTCVKIASERFGDTRKISVIHAHNKLGPSPHHLKPGSVLRLPRPEGNRGPDARITYVRNLVEAFKPEPKPAEVNETLFRGHKVGTKEASSTELLFVDKTRIQLGEHTLIVVLGGTVGEAREQSTATTLLNGALRARLGELSGPAPSQPTMIKTDAADIALGAGEAQVHVDTKKTTRLAVYRGRSSARAKGKTVEVPEGFGNQTENGKAPDEPKPLPPAPLWTVAPPAELPVADTGTITAKYGPGTAAGPAAAQWHVQIAREDEFHDLVVDVRVPASVIDLEAKGLALGPYLVRVSAIDAEGFEGPFGAVATTKVVAAPPPPPPPPPPPAPLPPPPPPAPTVRYLPAVAVLGGIGISPTKKSFIGPAAALELTLGRLAHPESAFMPVLGVRVAYEHFGASEQTLNPVPVSSRNALDVSLLAMLRLGKPASRFAFYGALAPQMAVAFIREDHGRSFHHAWLAGSMLVGGEVRLGTGRLLLEADGRYPVRASNMSKYTSIGMVQFLAGYRLGF